MTIAASDKLLLKTYSAIIDHVGGPKAGIRLTPSTIKNNVRYSVTQSSSAAKVITMSVLPLSNTAFPVKGLGSPSLTHCAPVCLSTLVACSRLAASSLIKINLRAAIFIWAVSAREVCTRPRQTLAYSLTSMPGYSTLEAVMPISSEACVVSFGTIRKALNAFRMTATSISSCSNAPCTGVR